MKWIFVGLGNPGSEYSDSRHNVGRVALEIFAKKEKIEWREDKKSNATVSTGENTTLILPNTFMNNSGKALVKYVKSIKSAKNTVVVYDDIDLPLGRIKFSFDRSSGGHNGVKSVEAALKTRCFWRIRIGVAPTTASGKPKKPSGEEAVIKFILGTFTPTQREDLKKVYKEVVKAIEMIVSDGAERAMNQFNSQFTR